MNAETLERGIFLRFIPQQLITRDLYYNVQEPQNA